MSAGLHTVHVRVNDAATGQPTPVRVRFTSPSGQYYAPLGRLMEFPTGENEALGGNVLLGGKKYAYIDGTCEIRLPAGPVRVEITKGPEYRPLVLDRVLGPGQLAVRSQVERWTDLRRDGWYSGDIRAHHLPPHAALLEGAAEDLAVVNLLASFSTVRSTAPFARDELEEIPWADLPEYVTYPNLLAFSGQRPALERPGHLVVVNTFNYHFRLGCLALLNCHRAIFPLLAEPSEGLGDWALADWCDQCHRKGGLVAAGLKLALQPDGRPPVYGEELADLIVGKIDAVETHVLRVVPRTLLANWYALLSCGLRVPLVGGSGKYANSQHLGSRRTYARLLPGQELSYRSWIEAVRAGRTFVTNGPLVSFTVNGQGPGAVLDLPSLDEPVRLIAEAQSMVSFDSLEIVLNGQPIAQAEATGSPSSAVLEVDAPLPGAGWLAARCSGALKLPDGDSTQAIGAHTSPIYVQIGGQPPPADPVAVADFIDQLDRLRQRSHRQTGNGAPPRHRLFEILANAREILEKRASG